MTKPRRSAMLLTFLALCGQAVGAAELQPFTAVYETSYGFMSARGERKVEARPDGTWQVQSNARALGFDLNESASFMLRNGHIHSLGYRFDNPFNKDRSQALNFNWSNKTVTETLSGTEQKLLPGSYDKLSYQLQLQLNACANPDKYSGEDFRVIDRKKTKTYRVEVVGRETLKTQLGTLNTLKLRQFRPGKEEDRDTEIWLATDWSCLLVRLDQNDNGDTHTLKLVSAKIGGKDVTAK